MPLFCHEENWSAINRDYFSNFVNTMSEEGTSNSVERAFSILEKIAESKNGLSNSDLSRSLKIPKSSASYILRVMERLNYFKRDNSGKYRIGLKLMSLTSEALMQLDIREIAKPVLVEFIEKSLLPEAHLAVLDNGRAVYIEKVESEKSFIKMDIWVGHRLPVHTTAIGKALTAYLTEDAVLEILKTRRMEMKTRKTIIDPAKYLRELEKVRKFGFALDNEENADGVRCLAAPIFDAAGRPVAVLGTSTVIMQIDDKHLPRFVKLIKEAAEKVSSRLGYIPRQSKI